MMLVIGDAVEAFVTVVVVVMIMTLGTILSLIVADDDDAGCAIEHRHQHSPVCLSFATRRAFSSAPPTRAPAAPPSTSTGA